MVYKGEFNAGQLIEFIGYFNTIVWPIMAVSELIDMSSRGKASLKRISELLDAEQNVMDREGVKELKHIKGDIEFRNLSFQYPDGEYEALEAAGTAVAGGAGGHFTAVRADLAAACGCTRILGFKNGSAETRGRTETGGTNL